MACSGDYCNKCIHWVGDKPVIRKTQWGDCTYFTNHPESPRMIYSGNINGLGEGETVRTTAQTKCRYFEDK